MLMLALLMAACTDRDRHGDLTLVVSHEVDGQPLVADTLCYTTEAGNRFLVTEVQWFLSKVELHDAPGQWIPVGDAFYIDTNSPESLSFRITSIPIGYYDELRFTFGFNDADNVTGRFSNPPERDMFWPEPLGGGYHYMKLNGRYLDSDGNLAPMNIHLGRGQNAGFTEFLDNSFSVEIPIDLVIQVDGNACLNLVMNIDNWFRNPHTYDINAFGSAIMQNQEAQRILKENGHDVFEVSTAAPQHSLVAQTLRDIMKKASPKPHFYSLKKS